MVSKCLIFSRSRFPLAWFVEGARSLVRGDGGRAPGRLSLTDQRAENARVVGDRRCMRLQLKRGITALFIDKVTEPP
jgi:hypothetical protein